MTTKPLSIFGKTIVVLTLAACVTLILGIAGELDDPKVVVPLLGILGLILVRSAKTLVSNYIRGYLNRRKYK